ncbi:MAG: hypothetical protein HY327_04400 [Chloroflexi bacterium]|nr:hypothetical protein [Chloroflexota bacterium]
MKIVIGVVLFLMLGVFASGIWLMTSSRADESTARASNELTSEDPVSTAQQIIENIKPKGALAPEIASSTWLNSPPLAPSDLRGKVVVVEFWTHG